MRLDTLGITLTLSDNVVINGIMTMFIVYIEMDI